jgi:hypothetical protein
MESRKEKERSFSVELKSRTYLTNLTLIDSSQENVLVEGTLGQLQHASVTDGVVIEVIGDKGVLRINLTKDEIREERKGNDVEN